MTRPLPTCTEAEFQAAVIDLARLAGWRVMHVRPSRGRAGAWTTATSISGWPDLVILGHGRVLFCELKAQRGRVTHEQSQLIAELRDCGLDARCWRPSDWPEIEATLTSPRARP